MFLLIPLTFSSVIAYLVLAWIIRHRTRPLQYDPRDYAYPDLDNDPDYQASLEASRLVKRYRI